MNLGNCKAIKCFQSGRDSGIKIFTVSVTIDDVTLLITFIF